MKKLATCCFGLLFSLGSVQSQDPLPATPPDAPVRVLGQANSPEELQAFNQIRAPQTAEVRVREGLAFLAHCPESSRC